MADIDSKTDIITAKDVILVVQSYVTEVKRRWKVILLIFIVLGSYKGIKAVLTEPVYLAKLTFMLNEEQGGLAGGLGSLLGDFGLGSGKEYNYQKLIELSKSRKIFSNVAMDTVQLDGKNTLLANALIDDFETYGRWGKNDWYKFWEETPALLGFRFHTNRSTSLDRLSRAALLALHAFVNNVLGITVEEDTGILTMKSTLHNEDLTQVLVERYFDELSNYYIEKTIEKQAATYKLLQNKVDSIQGLIRKKEYQIATYADTHRNVWSQKAKVPQSQLKKEVHLLYVMLGEAIKNKELADFTLNNKTPFIQAIDRPIQPLPALQPSWWMEILRAGVVSLLVGGLYIGISKWFRDTIKS